MKKPKKKPPKRNLKTERLIALISANELAMYKIGLNAALGLK
jgi:hypothetical protein